jgi:hypothetical protein
MFGRFFKLVLALSVVIFSISGTCAEFGTSDEYKVKAAFLYNFSKFIEWPAGAFKDHLTPIGLYVLGSDPFGEALDSLKEKTVNGRKFVIRRIKRVEEAEGGHILFISTSEKGRNKEILQSLGNTSILTVSEVERFCQIGGMINFVVMGDRVQFEINPESAQKRSLKISSQLLRLAKIVSNGP